MVKPLSNLNFRSSAKQIGLKPHKIRVAHGQIGQKKIQRDGSTYVVKTIYLSTDRQRSPVLVKANNLDDAAHIIPFIPFIALFLQLLDISNLIRY